MSPPSRDVAPRVQARKETERLRKEAEKETERWRKEEERKAKEVAKEAEKEARVTERRAEQVRQQATVKKQAITNFFGGPAASKAPGVADPDGASPRRASAGSATSMVDGISSPQPESVPAANSVAPAEAIDNPRQIYLRGGRRVAPFYHDTCTSLARLPHERPPSCPSAARDLVNLTDFLLAKASGDGAARRPRLSKVMRALARRESLHAQRSVPAWRWARVKVLQFAEDVRPAYRGTFTHPSKAVGAAAEPQSPGHGDEYGEVFGFGNTSTPGTDHHFQDSDGRFDAGSSFESATNSTRFGGASGGSSTRAEDASDGKPFGNGAVSRRRPFGRDVTLFDYEVDSEAEWESEEEGEDLGSDCGEVRSHPQLARCHHNQGSTCSIRTPMHPIYAPNPHIVPTCLTAQLPTFLSIHPSTCV